MIVAGTTTAYEDIVQAIVVVAVRDYRSGYQERDNEPPAYAFLHALGVLEAVDTVNTRGSGRSRVAASRAEKPCAGAKTGVNG
jgi:hypothetical protein